MGGPDGLGTGQVLRQCIQHKLYVNRVDFCQPYWSPSNRDSRTIGSILKAYIIRILFYNKIFLYGFFHGSLHSFGAGTQVKSRARKKIIARSCAQMLLISFVCSF